MCNLLEIHFFYHIFMLGDFKKKNLILREAELDCQNFKLFFNILREAEQ